MPYTGATPTAAGTAAQQAAPSVGGGAVTVAAPLPLSWGGAALAHITPRRWEGTTSAPPVCATNAVRLDTTAVRRDGQRPSRVRVAVPGVPAADYEPVPDSIEVVLPGVDGEEPVAYTVRLTYR